MRRLIAASLLLAAACAPATASAPSPDAQPPEPMAVCHPLVVNYEGGYAIALCIFPLIPAPDPEERELEA